MGGWYKVRTSAGRLTLERTCTFYGGQAHLWQVTVGVEQYRNFDRPDRPRIQECFPDLPAPEREFFLTGICPACFEKLKLRSSDTT